MKRVDAIKTWNLGDDTNLSVLLDELGFTDFESDPLTPEMIKALKTHIEGLTENASPDKKTGQLSLSGDFTQLAEKQGLNPDAVKILAEIYASEAIAYADFLESVENAVFERRYKERKESRTRQRISNAEESIEALSRFNVEDFFSSLGLNQKPHSPNFTDSLSRLKNFQIQVSEGVEQ